MQADAERFRRRDSGPVSEQSPPSAAQSVGRQPREQQGAPQSAPQQRYAPPQYAPPQYAPPHQAPPQHAPPPYGIAQPAMQRFPPPVLEARDAPLIHPAAAQASSALHYGIPVYQAPVYAYPPHAQRGLSITAFVLGICSAVFAWTLVVVPIIGIVFGFIALRREPAGRTMAAIGLATSAIGLLWILLWYVLPLLGVLGAMLFAFGSV